MGKLIVTEFITLDGIIDDPGGSEGHPHGGWSFRFPAPEGQQFKFEELLAADVQLMGRVTYEGFAAAWPAMEESTGEFGKRMNSMPKVVVSTTLTDPAWNNTTVISGDVPAGVARLKEQYQGDVLVPASATLVDAPDPPAGHHPGRRGPPRVRTRPRRASQHPRPPGLKRPGGTPLASYCATASA